MEVLSMCLSTRRFLKLATHRFTTVSIPRLIAFCPWQLIGDRSEEESKRPGDDNIVEEIHVKRNENDSIANSLGKINLYRKSGTLHNSAGYIFIRLQK